MKQQASRNKLQIFYTSEKTHTAYTKTQVTTEMKGELRISVD